MGLEHEFEREETLPSWWANAIQEFLSNAAPSFTIEAFSATVIRVFGGDGDDRAAVAIDGRWRYNDTPVTATVSGAAGTRYIYVTAEETDIVSSPDPFTDATDRSFGLEARTSGAGAPSSDVWRLVGTLEWSGTAIVEGSIVNYGSDWIFQQYVQSKLAPAVAALGIWTPVARASGAIYGGAGAATRVLASPNVGYLYDTSPAPSQAEPFWIDGNDYELDGYTTMARLRVFLLTGDTAPGTNLSVELKTLIAVGGATAGELSPAGVGLEADCSFTTPGANTIVKADEEFELGVFGAPYILTLTNASSIAGAATAFVSAEVAVRHVPL